MATGPLMCKFDYIINDMSTICRQLNCPENKPY